MPFIHIKSLPLVPALDLPEVLRQIAKDFAGKTQIALRHVHVTWEYFEPGHYLKGTRTPESHPRSDHPILADLLTPDFNDGDTVALMLTTVADSLSKNTGIEKRNIFINHRQARSGMVYDAGQIGRW